MTGIPQWIPTDSVCQEACEMASRCLTVSQISDCLGIAESILYAKQDDYKEFMEAIKRGRAEGPKDFLRRSNDGKGLEYEIVRFCGYVQKYYAVKVKYGLSFQDNDSATFEQCGVSIS